MNIPLYKRNGKSRSGSNNKLRWKLVLKTCGRCAYCGELLKMNDKRRIVADIDHIIPRIKGGSDHHSNLVLACRRCNSSKGKKDLGEFREYRDVDRFPFEMVDRGIILDRFKFNGEETALCSLTKSYDHVTEMAKDNFSSVWDEEYY